MVNKQGRAVTEITATLRKIYKTKQITAMQEHAQRKTNETILAGLRIIEFGNGGIGNSGEVALTGDAR